MGKSDKETIACGHCGAEADIILEGFEGVKDVLQREKKLVCEACGKEIASEPGQRGTYACRQCGAEADITIEGFEGVEDVLKRGKNMTCRSCGREMPWTEREDLKAIMMAMDAEKKACQFYAKAAKQTKNPKGRDMFQQLSEFEMNHYQRLKELSKSLSEKGEWILYSGTSLKRKTIPIKAEQPKGRDQLTDMDALEIAIKEEKKAQANYRSLAELTADERGKNMYRRLAEEEALHEKVLNDQYYSLHNTGIWNWGD